MKLQGTVLWFDTRDGNGIIKDADGNEFYTDISVIKDRAALKHGQRVSFTASYEIKHCPCARNVEAV